MIFQLVVLFLKHFDLSKHSNTSIPMAKLVHHSTLPMYFYKKKKNQAHFPFQVCPAGWNPGNDTIVPKIVESKAYFAKHWRLFWTSKIFLKFFIRFLAFIFQFVLGLCSTYSTCSSSYSSFNMVKSDKCYFFF